VPTVSEFVRQIRRAGCVLVRHGKKHDIWKNPATDKEVAVSRHPSKELPRGTYHSMLRDLGLE